MNAIKQFVFSAIFIASAITISCSSDDGDGGGGDNQSSSSVADTSSSSSEAVTQSSSSESGSNLSDLPNDVYLVKWEDFDNDYDNPKKEKYEDDGDVVFIFNNNNTIPAGKIQNGQLILDLPENIDSKYLGTPKPCDPEDCKSTTFSVVPENLAIARINADVIFDGNDCRLRINLTKSGKTIDNAAFYYASETGKITGTEIYDYDDDEEYRNFDMHFSKGWNIVYPDREGTTRTNSTNRPEGSALELWLLCN